MVKELRSIYICCEKGKESFYQERAENIYKESVRIVRNPEEAFDMLVIVLPVTEEMKEIVSRSEEKGIRSVSVNEYFVPADTTLYESLLRSGS